MRIEIIEEGIMSGLVARMAGTNNPSLSAKPDGEQGEKELFGCSLKFKGRDHEWPSIRPSVQCITPLPAYRQVSANYTADRNIRVCIHSINIFKEHITLLKFESLNFVNN